MESNELPTKKGIQKVTISARKEAAKDGIKKVIEKIEEAAMSGKFDVLIWEDNLVVSTETIEQLKNNGFHIKKLYGDVDEHGQYYQGGLKIHWKETIWDRFVKMFFGEVQ